MDQKQIENKGEKFEKFDVKHDPEGKNFNRLMGLIIVLVFLSMGVGSAGVFFFNPEWSAHMLKISDMLLPMTGGVVIFFFGGMVVSHAVKSKARGRNGK